MSDRIKGKGLREFLAEDSSLTNKMTYEEFQNKKAAPDNSDDDIDKVYRTYRTLTEKL